MYSDFFFGEGMGKLKELISYQIKSILSIDYNTRKFITSNFLFGLFNPFYFIFSNTYIYNITKGSLEKNIVYCIFSFAGIIFGFFICGFLSRKIPFKTLLITGTWLMFITILGLFTLRVNSNVPWITIILSGFLTGTGSGSYWSARNYLTNELTNNKTRDFISGIDYVLINLGRIITPFIIGIYLEYGIAHDWFAPGLAYQSILIPALALAIFTTLSILRVENSSKREKVEHFKPSNKWKYVRYLLYNLGFFQGAFFVVPSVFIMKYIGKEGMVGTLNAVGYIISTIFVFFISSRSNINHRSKIMMFGATLFFIGAALFAIYIPFNPKTGTYFLIFSVFFADSILNFPARATIFNSIVDEINNDSKDSYQYLTDVEIFSGFGRISGLIIFYLMFILLPVKISLSLYIIGVSLIQFYSVRMSKKINGF